MTFEIWKKYSKNKNAHNYLFPRTKFGNAISNQKYNSYIKEICKHIGLDRGVRVRDWDLNGKEENTSFYSTLLNSLVTYWEKNFY